MICILGGLQEMVEEWTQKESSNHVCVSVQDAAKVSSKGDLEYWGHGLFTKAHSTPQSGAAKETWDILQVHQDPAEKETPCFWLLWQLTTGAQVWAGTLEKEFYLDT